MRRRAHHLAKELGVSLKDIVRAAEHGLGMQIRSQNVLLRPEQIREIRTSLNTLGLMET